MYCQGIGEIYSFRKEELDGTFDKCSDRIFKIVGSFLHDIPYQLPENFKELPELYKLAEAHNLSAAVYEVIRNDQILKRVNGRISIFCGNVG